MNADEIINRLYRCLESYHAEATSKGSCRAGASCECRWHRSERILALVHVIFWHEGRPQPWK
jgi:hypothetical protein